MFKCCLIEWFVQMDFNILCPNTNFFPSTKFALPLGRGGGLVVSMLTLYSDNPSLNPVDDEFCLSKDENR